MSVDNLDLKNLAENDIDALVRQLLAIKQEKQGQQKHVDKQHQEPKQQANNNVLDINGAFDYFGGLISKWLLYEAVKRKELPHISIGRRVLFRQSALDAWMQAKEIQSISKEYQPKGHGKIRRIL